MSAMEKVAANINWKLLREQKITLLGEASRAMENKRPALEGAIDGVVGLIDALQDAAVEDGVPEHEVFGDLA
jgi:hypothetical protein